MQIKQKYPIDFAKSITWLVVIGLIYYFNQLDNIYNNSIAIDYFFKRKKYFSQISLK